MMIALLLSDLHGEELFLERISEFSEEYDCVFVLGDICGGFDYVKRLSSIHKYVFAIPGNCDGRNIEDAMIKNGIYVHMKKINFMGYEICGLGYSGPTPFGTPGERDELFFSSSLNKLDINKDAILLCHSPPFGFFDMVSGQNTGIFSLRKAIMEQTPKACLFGHIHEYKGCAKFYETLLIKVPAAESYEYAEMKLDDSSIEVQFKRLSI